MDRIKSRFLELLDIINQASPPNWEGYHNAGFGVEIPNIIAIKGEHADYIKWRDAVAILATRNTAPNFLEAAILLLDYVQKHSKPENFRMNFTDANKVLEKVVALVDRDLDSPNKPKRQPRRNIGWNGALEEAAAKLERTANIQLEMKDEENRAILDTFKMVLRRAAEDIRELKK